MPVQIKTTFKGDKVIQSGLTRVKTEVGNIPAGIIRPEMEQAADETGRGYPPELPGQRYVRTGARYAATRVEAGANNQYSKSYTVVSDPKYAGGRSADPYVLGDARGRGQAAIHRGRWKLLYVAVTEAIGRAVSAAERIVRGTWEGGGL